MKIRYNAPVTLTFSLLCLGVLILQILTGGVSTKLLFTLHGSMNVADPLAWVRLFTYVLGHADWAHLMGNLSFLLLLGPILEEKYGSRTILILILITAVITSVLNVLLFHSGLMGASGVVFMFILLSSFTNFRSGEIPLTFILVVTMYLAKEIFDGLGKVDNISQFAHLLGGGLGSLFGFLMPTRSTKE